MGDKRFDYVNNPGGDQVGAQNAALTQQLALQQAKLDARPQMPEFESMLGEGGMMPEQYQLKMDPYATSWLGAEREALAQQQGQMMDRAQQQQLGGQREAEAGLAMRGGLTGGARERLAKAGQAGLAQTHQQIAATTSGQRHALESEGAKRMSGLAQEQQKYNIGGALAETEAERRHKLQSYMEQMRAYGAEKSAQATAGGGGGGKK